MTKSKNRKLVVDGNTYLWNRKHINHDDAKCAEKLTVYLEGYKASPLRIMFQSHDNTFHVGRPNQGEIWNADITVNLNRPAVVVVLIKHCLEFGWCPADTNSPFEVQHGIELIGMLSFPDVKEGKGVWLPIEGSEIEK